MHVSPRLVAIAISASLGFVGLPAQAIDCFYTAKQSESNPSPQVELHRDCGRVHDHRLDLAPSHLRNLSIGKNGLGHVFSQEAWFYVNESGRSVRTHGFDNGPDYFSEGLARGIVSDKFGFIDESLSFVIQPRFDFALPFASGHAVVCNRCRRIPDGEHWFWEGGVWGVIDKKGEVVVPLEHQRDELEESAAYRELGK